LKIENKNTVSEEFNYRYVVIHWLNITFITFASLYLLYFYLQKEWAPMLAIAGIISVFASSFYCNLTHRHTASKFLIIGGTQIGNFLFSLYIGFNTGIHMYNLTAPLITFLLIGFENKKQLYLTLAINILNFLLQFYIVENHLIESIQLPNYFIGYFYKVNLIGVMISLIVLTYYLASTNGHITKLLRIKNESLTHSLNEKELLLTELHHRVKNNLAQISAIMNLQLFNLEDKTAINTLENTLKRVNMIAIIQENIYQNEALSKITLHSIVQILKKELEKKLLRIDLPSIEAEEEIDIVKALPIALLINEFLMNISSNISNEVIVKISFGKQNEYAFVEISANQAIEPYQNNNITHDIIEALLSQLKAKIELKKEKELSLKILY